MTAAEVSSVIEFLGKNVSHIDNTRLVSYFEYTRLVEFADIVVAEIQVLCSFVSEGGNSINSILIVVV